MRFHREDADSDEISREHLPEGMELSKFFLARVPAVLGGKVISILVKRCRRGCRQGNYSVPDLTFMLVICIETGVAETVFFDTRRSWL